MVTENEEMTTVEEVQVSEALDAPVVEATEGEMPDSEATEVDASSEESAASWDNFKYTVRDEEKEFDEWARPYIKDEDTYKRFQDLYTARDGLTLAKQERDEFKDKFSTLNESLETVNKFVHQGDAESFIQALGLPPQMFINYAINKLKYNELPPEEKARVDGEREQQIRLRELETQNMTLQQQYELQSRQQRTQELEMGLTDPTVAEIARDFDSRVGTPGAFRQRVVERGIYHSQVNGQDISARQAIDETVNLFGLRAAGVPNQPTQQVANAGMQAQTTGISQSEKPVIPNFKGRGTSPLRKTPKSIDDIRQIREQRFSSQGA